MTFPTIARVRRSYHQHELSDVSAATVAAIHGSRVGGRLKPAGHIAITVGSRGIADIARIVRATAEALRALGFDPFVVAAMGSHGGGTAVGQRSLLSELGVTEDSIQCPIRTDMETVVLGTNSFGLPIHFDRNAIEADGIVLLNRIKPHTSFTRALRKWAAQDVDRWPR